MKLSLIVALSRNGVIGKDGGLPWDKIPEDMANFRRITMGHSIVMGSKTFRSIGKALRGRKNIVLSRTATLTETEYLGHSLFIARTPAEAIYEAFSGHDDAFVIGGAEIYRLFAPLCDEMHITSIDRVIVGDTEFPWKVVGNGWDIRETKELATDVKYEHWVRKSS